MALVAQSTKISVPTSQRPSGYTDSGGTNLSGSQPKYEGLVLTILKATVENATEATTFNNIRTNATIGIEKQIADKLGLEMDDAANTITYNIDWKAIRNNQGVSQEFFTNVAASYYAIVDVYINIS